MGRKIDQIITPLNKLCTLLIWGCMVLFTHLSVAQNLIYNPGAEIWNDTTVFRMWGNEFYTPNCDGWFLNLPNNNHRFGLALLDNSTPAMLGWKDLNQLVTQTGKGIFWIHVGQFQFPSNATTSSRQYLQTRLLDTLQEGCYYSLTYSVRPFNKLGVYDTFLNNNGWSVCKNLGFWFTQGRVRDTVSSWGYEFSSLNPQPQVRLPQDYYITDTTQFTQLSAIFQANGGETHLTIGNFWHPDSSIFYHLRSGHIFPHGSPTAIPSGSSYFLDDMHLALVAPPDSVLKTTNDTSLCTGDTLQLHASAAHAQWYQWSTGSTDSSIVITQPGTYWVTCGFNCGFSLSDTIRVLPTADQPPVVSSQDTIICPGDREGAYHITARNRCFETQSLFALHTEACETKVWMPNTFTPNGDGLNDCVAPVLVNVLEQDYHLIITDRWGNVVFETTEHNACWDGTFQGQKIAGVYTWRLIYRGLQTGYGTAQGFVQVYL
jgi:gliding motility-associated-like protein